MLAPHMSQTDLDSLEPSPFVFYPSENRSGAEWTTTCIHYEDSLFQGTFVANGTPASGTRGLGDEKSWSTFRQPLYAVALLSVAYILVAVVGVVSNALVVTVIYRQPKMRSVTNYFLSNLAIADILVCILVLPITLLENIFTGRSSVSLYWRICGATRLNAMCTVR